MKKCLLLLLLLQTNIMFANCCPCSTEVCTQECCSSVGWSLYGEALFLQPNGSNLIFAMQADPTNPKLADPLVEANWFSHEINPSYHPAFEIGAKCIFQDIEMNLALDWERLRSSDSKHFSLPFNEAMTGPLFDIGPDAKPYIHAKGKAIFHFDKVDLLLEKRMFSKHCWAVDLCAGASFAYIKQSIRRNYFNDGATLERIIESPSTFTGGGPTFGFNFDFILVNCFKLTGSSSISLIVGQLKNKTKYESFAPDLTTLGVPQPNTERSHVPNRTQLVPGFEERLGFAYDFPFRCGNFSVEAGYLFQIFLNAIQTLDITVIVTTGLPFPNTVGYYAQGFERTLSNFMLTGPYLKMNIDF